MPIAVAVEPTHDRPSTHVLPSPHGKPRLDGVWQVGGVPAHESPRKQLMLEHGVPAGGLGAQVPHAAPGTSAQ